MASKHMVTCVQCGNRFDANRGGYYNSSSRRYTCLSCGNAQKSAYRQAENKRKADEREKKTGMRQSYGAMITKIAFGILFVFASFSSPEDGWSIGYFLTAMLIGGSLIAWGLIPYLKAKNAKQTSATDTEPYDLHTDNTKTCTSCGAKVSGAFCEYCGAKLSD